MSHSSHIKSSQILLAQNAVEDFIRILEVEGLSGFVASFRQVADALRRGDAKLAVEFYARVPVSGMGGLSDIYASDQSAFDSSWSAVSRTLRDLRDFDDVAA